MTRWDSPLFTVPYEDEGPPCEAIWEAMVGSDGKAKVVRPNLATVLVCALGVSYVGFRFDFAAVCEREVNVEGGKTDVFRGCADASDAVGLSL